MIRAWGLLILLALAGVHPVAGAAHPPRAAPDTTRPVVREVRVRGHRHFSERRLKQQIRTAPNRRVLGIPGFTWWRWIYQLGSTDWMWSRLGQALRSGGEAPAYLDTTIVDGDVERLRLFYRQQGFREASVSSSIRRSDSGDRATVTFRVEPGPATYLHRVEYDGLKALSAREKRELARGTVLNAARHDARTPLTFSVVDQRFRQPLLLKERRRVLSFLQNAGYAAVSRDSIRAIVFENRAPPGSLDVTFRVQTGPQYRFGDVHYRIQGPERAPARRDTIDVPVDAPTGRAPIVTSRIEDETQLDLGLLRRALQFTPGTVYRRSSVLATKQRLEGTGVFTLTSLSPQFDESTVVDSVRYLPIRIEGQTRQRHRLRMETFGLQRAGVSFGTSEFGVGLGGVYENVNALGGGETFRLRTSGSVATSLDSTLITSRQLEGTVSLTLPYLIRPFGRFENLFDLSNARTQISVSVLTARRNDLGLRIRSRSSARLRLEMNHTPSRTSLVDVLDLSVSNPDTLSGFGNRFLDSLFVRIQDPVQRAQILQDFTQPQINTAFRYTFRSSTVNPLRRRRGHDYELSGEVGNTLPLLFDRFIFVPGTLEYSVPGLSGSAGRGPGGQLVYRPYLRGTVDLRRYVRLSQGTTLAMKLFGGMAHPTGRPTLVPFDRRFFSGGASSVRGWRLRELGPGGAGQRIDFLGGDVKLESSVELRTTMLRDLLAADWVGAPFLDVGNVWFGPRNQGFSAAGSGGDGIGTDPNPPPAGEGPDGKFRGLEALTEVGVGAGVGLRIEWEYLVVRFDLAYRLHDPSPQNDDVFSDDFGGPLLHFGIGQAF
ncbi:MAG: BamA/TamA family outer membrane protein [Salinibacter sp.]